MAVEAKAIEVARSSLPDVGFIKGIYQHFKGGRYLAIDLAWAHEMVPETPVRVVLYYCLDKGTLHVRPFNARVSQDSSIFMSNDCAAWTDEVLVERTNGSQVWEPRFRLIRAGV